MSTTVRLTTGQIQIAIHTAKGFLKRASKEPIPLSTEETLFLSRAILTLAYDRKLLGNDDAHDMFSEFATWIDTVSKEANPAVQSANTRQVGGEHYGLGALQHWDIVHLFKLDYFQGQITKYLFRWRKKNGVEDLEKAKHYLEKYIEINMEKTDAVR